MNKGWPRKRLGEIADVQSGGTPLVSVSAYWNGDLPWYSSGELNDRYTSARRGKFRSLGWRSANAKLLPKGYLIGMYDTAALKVAVFQQELSQRLTEALSIFDRNVFDDDAATPSGLKDFDVVLEEE